MELQEAVMDRENYTDALEKKADEVEVPRCRNISGDRKHVRTSLAGRGGDVRTQAAMLHLNTRREARRTWAHVVHIDDAPIHYQDTETAGQPHLQVAGETSAIPEIVRAHRPMTHVRRNGCGYRAIAGRE